MIQDLRFALRSLLVSRGFTAAAVLTLALGIGATTVVYGVVDALLLRPAPFGPRSDRLVTLHSTHPTQAQDWDDSGVSYADLLDIGRASTTLDAVAGVMSRNISLSTEREAERVRAASVTPNLFDLLQVTPRIGRSFEADEGAAPGFETVVIISDALWKRLYAADPSVSGRSILINGRNLTVVGVMPPRFAFPDSTDAWLPYQPREDPSRSARSMLALGLLRAGTTIDAARADAGGIAAELATRYPQTNRDWGIHLLPVRDFFVTRSTRGAVTSMLLAVALVLIVGCANVASLLVARGIARQRELLVRAALGAGRLRLIRLMLAESLWLALAGGGLGLLLAAWGLDALLASNPEPPPYWAHLGIDGRIIVFTAALSAITAVLCGMIPALRVSRIDISSGALQAGRTSGAAKSERRVQGVLVTAQVAISFALLVGATLLAQSTLALQRADIGFDERNILSFRMYIAGDAYDDEAARARVVTRVVEALRGIPGVAGAAATGAIPGDDGGDPVRLVPPQGVHAPGGELGAQMVPASGQLFETLGLRLLEGRSFTQQEAEDHETNVAIVNRTLANAFWPGANAAGQQLRIALPNRTVSLRVIGVAPDLVYEELGEQTAQSRMNVYVPHGRMGWRSMALMVRTAGDPNSLAAAARRAIHDVDRSFAAFDMSSMEDRRAFTMWGQRFLGRAFAAFAIAALLLACLGAYGLTAYAAVQRTREIGVRLAIGATRRDIVRLLLTRDGRLALVGLAIGLPVAALSAKFIESLLFQVSAWEADVWLATPVALLFAILTASFLPARRASRTDPATALRSE